MRTLITAPEIEPVRVEEVALHLRLDDAQLSDEGDLIDALITAARTEAETITGRALITQTWSMTLDGWPSRIELPRQRVQSVVSITYVDTSGATQTLAANQYRLSGWDQREIIPAYGVTWPTVRGDDDCITVQWVAGYGDNADDVPRPLRQWMLMRIGTLYAHREEFITGSIISRMEFVDRLLDPYRVPSA